MYDPVVITLLEKNVKELQEQLVNAHKRIKVLADENYELRRKIIGQDDAILKVSQAIQRARTGLKNPNHPIGSFMFLGPT